MRSRFRLKEGWSTYFLLLIIHMLAVWALSAAEWADGLGLLIWVVLVAVTLGMLLAKQRWLPGVVSHIFATVVGLAWTVFLVSHILPGAMPVKERMLALVYRFMAWLDVALGQGVSGDGVIFVLQLGVLLWLAAYLGTWFTFRRHQVWAAIIPVGLVILINSLYAPSGVGIYFVLYLFCALLLIVRVHVLAEQTRWQANRIAFSPDIAWDFLRDGMILSLVIVLSALFLPNALASPRWSDIWDTFSRPWQRVQDEWARLYSSLRSQQAQEGISFGRALALGGPVRLSDTPFMVVESPRPLYWRAAVYDEYTGRGWVNSDRFSATWPAREYWPVPTFDSAQEITQTVKPLQSGEFRVYAAGQPIWADIPVAADVTYVGMSRGGGMITGLAEPSSIRALRAVSPSAGYTVISSVPTVSERRLRDAGTNYPTYVLERYLDLPATLPSRVADLAREITASANTPYEACVAIERYLRREYRYDQSVEAPPPGADAVDHFLFVSKAGYCDYYASAMVVMLRTIGIPARIAAGYTSGGWDPNRRGYVVLYSDAHSWPEVFFPNYGWIPFEPTASEPLIVRPSDEPQGLAGIGIVPPTLREDEEEAKFGADELAGTDETGATTPSASETALRGWRAVALGAGVLALLAGLGAALWGALAVRRMKPAERLFALLVWLARLAGVRKGDSETPREFAVRLARTIGGCEPEALFFADLYYQERFSARKAAPVDRDAIRRSWASLRRHILAYRWRRLRLALTPKPRVVRVPITRW
ncbi:MAG: transglutaminase domain-containing protein [Chloroflexi bacterium]|nr:transglutaminase domain-containing protein [Chloroflexota bacterium]